MVHSSTFTPVETARTWEGMEESKRECTGKKTALHLLSVFSVYVTYSTHTNIKLLWNGSMVLKWLLSGLFLPTISRWSDAAAKLDICLRSGTHASSVAGITCEHGCWRHSLYVQPVKINVVGCQTGTQRGLEEWWIAVRDGGWSAEVINSSSEKTRQAGLGEASTIHRWKQVLSWYFVCLFCLFIFILLLKLTSWGSTCYNGTRHFCDTVHTRLWHNINIVVYSDS